VTAGISIDRAHEKRVIAGRKAGEVDRALIGRGVPVWVRAFQFVLIAKRLAGREGHADEVDLQLVPVRLQPRQAEGGFAERGDVSIAHPRRARR